MKKKPSLRRAAASGFVPLESIPAALLQAQTRVQGDSFEGDLLKIFGEWIKFAGQYANVDPDAKATEVQARRGQCECTAIAATINVERKREDNFADVWVNLQQGAAGVDQTIRTQWDRMSPEERASYLQMRNDYASDLARAEQGWKETSGKISWLNQQLKVGCGQYFQGLIRKTWAERKQEMEGAGKFLDNGGGKVRALYAQRYQGASGPVVRTVIARNRLAVLASKLSGKPFHALSVTLSTYLGSPPSAKASRDARSRCQSRMRQQAKK